MSFAKREYPRDTREFVRIGYNDACINFLVKFDKYSFDELVHCLKDVTEYNEYNEYNEYKGVKVANAFNKIKEQVQKAYFGREGSPVLYLHVVQFDWENDELVVRSPERMAEVVAEIKKAFSRTKADEFDVEIEKNRDGIEVPAIIRLWWD